MKWTAADIPDQTGKTALVTGANSGIGFHTALELARAGARVVVAVRDEAKGKAAIRRLQAEVPDADLHLGLLDLADLGSVHRFAAQVMDSTGPLDLFVNSAGVMGVPQRLTTRDGFELQFGTNHLGHFALTGLLLPGLLTRPGARVVTVSSLAHEQGQIRFDDLQGEEGYDPGRPTPSPSWRTCCSRLNSIARPGHAGWTSSASRYTRACRRRIFRSLGRGWDTKVSGRVADCSSYVGSGSRPHAEHCHPCTPQQRRRLSAAASTGRTVQDSYAVAPLGSCPHRERSTSR